MHKSDCNEVNTTSDQHHVTRVCMQVQASTDTGLDYCYYILLRVCLFLIFSLNTIGDPTINLLATAIAMLCLFAYLSMVGGVYKYCCLILNLGILSAASLYQINSGVTVTSITYISTSIGFAFFMAFVFHHMIVKII